MIRKINSKLVLNILKVMWNSIFIYTHWAPSSKKILKNILTYMCGPCPSMWEPIMNYELTTNALKKTKI